MLEDESITPPKGDVYMKDKAEAKIKAKIMRGMRGDGEKQEARSIILFESRDYNYQYQVILEYPIIAPTIRLFNRFNIGKCCSGSASIYFLEHDQYDKKGKLKAHCKMCLQYIHRCKYESPKKFTEAILRKAQKYQLWILQAKSQDEDNAEYIGNIKDLFCKLEPLQEVKNSTVDNAKNSTIL